MIPHQVEPIKFIKRGERIRRFLIQVPGAAQSTLSDAELAALLNWMIPNLSASKLTHFTRFTEAEVASLRRTPLVDVQGTRRQLVQSLRLD